MKHPASRELYACWQLAYRQPLRQPQRPRQLRGYGFAVTTDQRGGFPLSEVGPGLHNLLGSQRISSLTGRPFAELFASESRAAATALLAIAACEALATVAGITGYQGRRPVPLELLVLPPIAPAAGNPATTLGGLLAPLAAVQSPLGDLTLTSWRHLRPLPPPRALRKVAVAPGLMLYEGRD